MINETTLEWLMAEDDPSLKYRVLTELLELPPNDKEVLQTKSRIEDSPEVKRIMSKMNPAGYWLQFNPRTKEYTGDSVEYGSFASTHFCLSYLSELGMTKENPSIALASERYLNLQSGDGDWYLHLSCLYGYNVRTFIKLGYKDDDRVRKTIRLILGTDRHDNGYLCDIHEKRSKKKKSCIRGAAKVLMAMSELPEYWDHERCKSLVDYFLRREGIYSSRNKDEFVNKDMITNTFPIGWQANTWEILYSLSKMGYGKDRRLQRAWDLLKSKRDETGRLILDWTPTQSTWKVGKKKEYNKWLTFYVLLAEKFRDRD